MKIFLLLPFIFSFFYNYGQNNHGSVQTFDTSKNGVLESPNKPGKTSWQYFKKGVLLYENLTKLEAGFCINGDCNAGKGKIIFEDGALYEGDVKDGKLNGTGRMKYANGVVFTGSYSNNRINGKGKMSWTDGSYYDGMWVDNTREGFGFYKWQDNSTYKGNWHNGTKQGKGTLVYADGSVYEGDFLNDKSDGSGTYTWGSGAIKGNKYIGNWSNDKQSGKGTYYTKIGDKYEGSFANGIFSGEGVYTFVNGDKYISDTWNGFSFTKGTSIKKGSSKAVEGILNNNNFVSNIAIAPSKKIITEPAPAKDYADLYKHIFESSAKDFKDSIGEKFTNERGEVFKASNYIDADETYYNKPLSNVGLTYFAVYKYENKNKDVVQKQMTDFINDYKIQGLASVEPSVTNGTNFILMKTKDNGKFIAALSDDPVKKIFQVWVFSGWNVVKAPNEFCIALQKAITASQSNAFSLSELQGEPNSIGPVFKNTGTGNSFYFSKLDIPGSKQTVLYKGVDKITFEAVMSVYQFKYMVQTGYEEIIKKVEGCINDLQMHVTKENNGPQNTFYAGDHVQIGVRWFTRSDNEFIIYIQVEHL